MTDEEMISRYPWIKSMSGYNMYEDIPEGWRKAFGQDLIDEIDAHYQELDKMEQIEFHLIQVKEKWGALRIYAIGEDEKFSEIFHKYEDISEHYCIECGELATHMTKGWVLPLCDKCDKERYNG